MTVDVNLAYTKSAHVWTLSDFMSLICPSMKLAPTASVSSPYWNASLASERRSSIHFVWMVIIGRL
jgi:hypothetical protein